MSAANGERGKALVPEVNFYCETAEMAIKIT
jgi:hypothetical protein